MDHNFRSPEGRAVGLAFSAAHKEDSTDTFTEGQRNILRYLAGATTSSYFVKTCVVYVTYKCNS